jgi:tetratricopeptide (TPR) repeat protein
LELDPGSLRVHSEYGFLLMALGRHDEAIREGLKAIELDPLSSQTQAALGRFLYRARKFSEAVPHCSALLNSSRVILLLISDSARSTLNWASTTKRSRHLEQTLWGLVVCML